MLKRINFKGSSLEILDQRLLPSKIKYLTAKTPVEVASAITKMVLRGAPLIGCSAAYGYALALNDKTFKSFREVKFHLEKSAKVLRESRPTAVALMYAIDRIHDKAMEFISKETPFNTSNFTKLKILISNEADRIHDEDVSANETLSKFGANLIKKKTNVMTICNAGALATAGIGTALGVIYKAFEAGKINHVYACETRPYLQGARLTMFELKQNKVPSSLITDNMSAHIMKTCDIGAIIVGADRIASNGDTANKIGTYMLSILAKYHKIPFYVAAPIPTFDLKIPNGDAIPIEERSSDEVCNLCGINIAPKNCNARHPAFDVAPSELITAIITENGIIKPVNKTNVLKICKK
jgi:methylthioribose-1-phosphate isomerase